MLIPNFFDSADAPAWLGSTCTQQLYISLYYLMNMPCACNCVACDFLWFIYIEKRYIHTSFSVNLGKLFFLHRRASRLRTLYMPKKLYIYTMKNSEPISAHSNTTTSIRPCLNLPRQSPGPRALPMRSDRKVKKGVPWVDLKVWKKCSS